ncbi:hypothetical protein SAMN05421688_2999 [Poseidonocella pacifica]|uniref:Galactosyl transferase GMA12/MNN10 family protein n=1 Tax=Poseidonocella pacifica TaxID=871651 RepID=A0A1I0YFR2_9RHOB|nr:hypothetical protein [Poseidonocella pacifica]SFB11667.1 hypothetical protein SAMN05421688_2999 [Poseidonocella pacifica]
MTEALREIAFLWIGGPLGFLDRLCMTSFLAAGHSATLFHYFPVGHVPAGVDVRDAREIYPNDDILIHRNGSPAMHADIFRLHLMKKTAMIWADTDEFCLRPFQPINGFLCARQTDTEVSNAVLRLPDDSAALEFALDFVKDPAPVPPWVMPQMKRKLIDAQAVGRPVPVTELPFPSLGPKLLRYALRHHGGLDEVGPVAQFLPLPSTRHRFTVKARLYDEVQQAIASDTTCGIHLWGTNLRKNGWLERIERGSFLERRATELGIELPGGDG